MDNEMELYIITRQQSKRELVAAISLNDGGYDYYLISSDGEPKSNSHELMSSFMVRNVHPRIVKIENIVQFIGPDNVPVKRIDNKNLQNQIFCRRIASLVDQSLKEEQEKDNKEKNREEYLKG